MKSEESVSSINVSESEASSKRKSKSKKKTKVNLLNQDKVMESIKDNIGNKTFGRLAYEQEHKEEYFIN